LSNLESHNPLEPWRRAWRAAAAVLAPNEVLALAAGLRVDDPRIIQGGTTSPPPLLVFQDWPVEAACPLSYCGWRAGLVTVAEVEEFFARLCAAIDERLGEVAACRYLLRWIDETPRGEMIAALLAEVETAPAPCLPSARERTFTDAGHDPGGPDHTGGAGDEQASP